MRLPVNRSLGDAATATEGQTPSAEGEESTVLSWQPIPRSFLHRRRVATSTPPDAAADPAPAPAPAPRRMERMTWPPARTPGPGLGRGSRALSSSEPRLGPLAAPPRRDSGANAAPSLTASTAWVPPSQRSHGSGSGALASPDSRGWLGSLAVPARRDAGASAPPSPTASTARVPPSQRSLGPSASSTTVIPSALPNARQAQPHASAASSLGFAAPPPSALASRGSGAPPTKAPTKPSSARRQPPMIKLSPPPKTKPPTGTGSAGALPPPPTTEATAGAAAARINLPPSPRLMAAFGQSIIEILHLLSCGQRDAPHPQLAEQPAGTRGAPLHTNAIASPLTRLGAPGRRTIRAGPLSQVAVRGRRTIRAKPLPQLAVSGEGTVEVLFNLNYGHLGYAGLVLLGLYSGLKEQMSGWSATPKILYVLLMIVGASSLGAGLMAATSTAPTSYTHRLSSICSRLCTCLGTFVLIVALACQMGGHGYIAGIALGAVAVGYIASVWIVGDPAAYDRYSWVRDAIKRKWQCFKWYGRRGPLLP